MRDGPRGFGQDSSCPALLRYRPRHASGFRVRGYHPLRPPFPGAFRYPSARLCRPALQPRDGVATAPVWAPARSLAATGAITFVFSSSGYLDVSVPRVGAPHRGAARSSVPGCPIRTSADLRVFAPPRGFSQLVASFLASESQGILHAPFSPFLFPLYGKVAFLDAPPGTVVPGAPRFCISTEGFSILRLLLSFCLVARFLEFCARRLERRVLCVFAVVSQLPACQCALSRCLFRVVPGRVELPTSTLSV